MFSRCTNILVSFLLLFVVGCTQDNTDVLSSTPSAGVPIRFTYNSTETRSFTDLNKEGFMLNIIYPSGREINDVDIYPESGTNYWISDPLLYWEEGGGDTEMIAYYPKHNTNSDYPNKFTLPTDQQSAEDYNLADLLVSTGVFDITDSSTYADIYQGIMYLYLYELEASYVDIAFDHLLSEVQVTVDISNEYDLGSNPIESITIYGTATTCDVDLKGEKISNPSDVEPVIMSPYSYERETDSATATYYAVVVPQNVEQMIISIKVGDKTYNKIVSDVDLIAGERVRYACTLGEYTEEPTTEGSYIEIQRDNSSSKITTSDTDGAIASILSKFRRCMAKRNLNDGVTISYLHNIDSSFYDGDEVRADLTGGDGDVMVYMPDFWYKYENIDDNYLRYYFSESEIEGGVYVSESLVGAFKGYIEGDKLYSISGVAPTMNTSYSDFVAASKAKGPGFNIIDYDQHCIIAMMLYAKYGDRDIQSHIGTGYASTTNLTGGTQIMGNVDSDLKNNISYGYISGLGIEGVFGGSYEWVSGVEIDSNYIWTITDSTTGESREVQAYTSMGNISAIAAESGTYFDMVPTAISGDTSTYYCDYYHPISTPQSSTTYYLTRSYSGYEENGGVAYADTQYSGTTTHSYIGSRLSFRGRITVESDIEKFQRLITYSN